MAASSHNRAFQAYNSHHFPNRPALKTSSAVTTKESLVFGRIPYSSIKTTIETASSTPTSPSPNSVVKPTPLTPKRRASINSIGHFLPRRKSLQMTALASQRQSLWMNIAKNAQTTATTQSSPLPSRQQQTSLLRRKLLRLLLVFSYLLSISLFAIALATFYGFFWSGYSTTQTVTDVPAVLSTPNTSIIDIDFSLEEVSSNKSDLLHSHVSFYNLVIRS